MRNKLMTIVILLCLLPGILITGCGNPKGVDDSFLIDLCALEGKNDVVIKSHNTEKVSDQELSKDYKTCDTVSVTYVDGEVAGFMAQNISSDIGMYLNKKTKEWEKKTEKITAYTIDTSELRGSCWKFADVSDETLSVLFEDEDTSGNKGAMYIRFRKKMGLFSMDLSKVNDTLEDRPFSSIGSGASVTLMGKDGNIDKSFDINGGYVTENGDVMIFLGAGDDKVELCLGTDLVRVFEREYDETLGLEVPADKVYMDELQVFDVTTTSIENGEWKQETGFKEGNKSPELSWDAVDGAGKYAVMMIDTSTNNILSWGVVVDTNHIDEGMFTTKESGYVGPYPPGTHTFEVFVVALSDDPKITGFQIDTSVGFFDERLTTLNTKADGSVGNVLAYGTIKAPYTSPELYYGLR